jgi:hypothetical protein
MNVIISSALTHCALFSGEKEKEVLTEKHKKAAIVNKKKQSPIRFMRSVKIPEVIEDWL